MPFPAKLNEKRSKLCAARYNYAHINHAKIEQKAKIIQIPIVEWVLVVPFYFEGDSVLENIDFMSGRYTFDLVHYDASIEALFFPA